MRNCGQQNDSTDAISVGLKGLVIAKDSATAYTPRAHGFNPFAFGETACQEVDKS